MLSGRHGRSAKQITPIMEDVADESGLAKEQTMKVKVILEFVHHPSAALLYYC